MTPEADKPPKPARSRRMVVWLVVLPVVFLLLALAAANWRVFHLAYCKTLLRSSDPAKCGRGITGVADWHVRTGMSLEEVQRLFHPVKVVHTGGWEEESYHEVLRPVVFDGALCKGTVEMRFDTKGKLTDCQLVVFEDTPLAPQSGVEESAPRR